MTVSGSTARHIVAVMGGVKGSRGMKTESGGRGDTVFISTGEGENFHFLLEMHKGCKFEGLK